MGEFKGSMTPEALIQALKLRSNIEIPIVDTPIESLNKLLQQQKLYKVMKYQPKEAEDLIEKLAQGQQLNPSETKRLNRLLIEANYPLGIYG